MVLRVLVGWVFCVEMGLSGDVVEVLDRDVVWVIWGDIVVFVGIDFVRKVVDFWVKSVWDVLIVCVVWVEVVVFGEGVEVSFLVEV